MAASAWYQVDLPNHQHQADQDDQEDPCHLDLQQGLGVLEGLRDLEDQLGRGVLVVLLSACQVQ